MDKHPLFSFFGFLGLLLLLVIAGSLLRKEAPAPEVQAPEAKQVDTYSFGDSPKMGFTATVEKSGVVSIYAQTPGIVGSVPVKEGQKVYRGQTIVSLSSNYQGGNAASLGRQIAQKNYDATVTNYDLQTDIIQNQRDIAEKGNTVASQMKEISKNSITDTENLISLNQSIVDSLNSQIATLQSSNAGGVNNAAILGAQQGLSAATAGLLNLKSGLRITQYQTDDASSSAQLPDATRDLAEKQLDLQSRGLALSKDLSELNLKLAKVNEGLMYPATPVSGTVQRVYVKVGQNVNPGTLIATISSNTNENTAVVLVPRDIAQKVSTIEESIFIINGAKVSVSPRFVSTESTDGTLYSVLYTLPAQFSGDFSNKDAVSVQIPLGSKKIVTNELYVPLDAVYQTQDKAYIYVEKHDNDKLLAHVVEVKLGEVSGNFVKVTSGITSADTIITTRNVQEGDSLKTN